MPLPPQGTRIAIFGDAAPDFGENLVFLPKPRCRGAFEALVAGGAWRRLSLSLAVLLLFCGAPLSSASAVPVDYTVTGGSAQITVMVAGVQVGQTTSPSLSGSFTLDDANMSIDAITLDLAPNIMLNLSSPYGGYDEITIEAASVTDSVGFGATLPPTAVGLSYSAYAGPLEVSGFWGATDSTGTNPTVSGQAINYGVPQMTAVVSPGPVVAITGVTLNVLDGAGFGEASDLTVLATFNVFAVPIPEPSSGLLAAWGLALVAAARRRSASRG